MLCKARVTIAVCFAVTISCVLSSPDRVMAQQPPVGWEWQHPVPAADARLVRTPEGGDLVLYARGNFWRSTDLGGLWTAFRAPFTSNHAFFRTREDGWAVGSDGAVARTTDGGASWTTGRTPLPVNLQEVYFVDAQHGWIRADSSTGYRTTDGGASWEKVQMGFTQMVFHDAEVGWGISISTPESLFRGTVDGGRTWRRLGSVPSESKSVDVSFVDPARGWAVTNSHYVYRSVDSGSVWLPIFVSAEHRFSAVHFINDQRGWLVGSGGAVAKTTDGGTTWSVMESGVPAALSDVMFLTATEGWIFGERLTLLHSTDGGAGWTKLPMPPTDRVTGLAVADALHAFASTAGGMLSTVDGGATWTQHRTGDSVRRVFALGQQLCWAASDSGVRRTTDGGDSWTLLSSQRCSDIHFFDPLAGVASTDDSVSGGIATTADGGMTWTQRLRGTRMHRLCFIDRNTGWAVGDGMLIMKTTDGGLTWFAQYSESGTMRMIDVQFLDANNGWAASASAYFYRTTDGGRSWTPIRVGKNYSLRLSSLHFWTLYRGVCTDQYGTLHWTSDGGRLWTEERLIGSGTWQKPGDVFELTDAVFLNGASGWVCGQDGAILKYSGDPTSSETVPSVGPVDVSISPQPVAREGRIRLTLDQPGAVDITLHTILGTLEQDLLSTELPAGDHVIPFTAEAPAGLYLVRVRTSRGITAKKILLTR